MMNKYVKYVLYVIVPLIIYFIILVIYASNNLTFGGCNRLGLPFEFYESCSGYLGPESGTQNWKITNLILDLFFVYIITGAIFYFLEKRHQGGNSE